MSNKEYKPKMDEQRVKKIEKNLRAEQEKAEDLKERIANGERNLSIATALIRKVTNKGQ